MRLTITILIAAILLTPSVLVAGPKATPTTEKLSAADVARAEKLIIQLGDNAYAKRLAAHGALEKMGPAVVEVLRRHRNAPDPEVAARVESLLGKLDWIGRGALVVRILPKSQADRLGMLRGDVIVRVDEDDITSAAGLVEYDHSAARQCTVWRRGELKTFRLESGKIGVYIVDWRIDSGGRAHAVGLTEAVVGNFGRAYDLLKTCPTAWAEDPWTKQIMVGLAESQLDHKLARKLYEDLQGGPSRSLLPEKGSWLTTALPETQLKRLPLASVHTDWMKSGSGRSTFEDQLEHYLGPGRNFPQAKAMLAKADGKGATPPSPGVTYARLRIAFHEGRWKDVLKHYLPIAESNPRAADEAVIAALNLGDVDTAHLAGKRLITGFRERLLDSYRASTALAAAAGALAAGRDDLANDILGDLKQCHREGQGLVMTMPSSRYLAFHGCTLDAMIPRIKALREELADWYYAPHLGVSYLASLRASEGTTLAVYQREFERYSGDYSEKWRPWHHGLGLLRFGQYAQARKALAPVKDSYWDISSIPRALEFLSGHRDRLERDWAVLKGTLHVYEAAARDAHWAVRYDGRTFYIDADGKVTEPPGVSAGEPHLANNGDGILVYPTGTICSRRNQIYLFDDKARRWIRTYASPGRKNGYVDKLPNATGPVLLRHLLDKYPVAGPGRELMIRLATQTGKWNLYLVNGDRVIAVQDGTHKIVDLVPAIAARLGRNEPVRVYRPHVKTAMTLIPTNAGMWTMDADGKLSRIVVDPKRPDAIICVLNWPKRQGKLYIGLAPQHGGKVYELDVATGKLALTRGYCGLGPVDAYDWFRLRRFDKGFVPAEYAIQKLYDKRLASRKAAK